MAHPHEWNAISRRAKAAACTRWKPNSYFFATWTAAHYGPSRHWQKVFSPFDESRTRSRRAAAVPMAIVFNASGQGRLKHTKLVGQAGMRQIRRQRKWGEMSPNTEESITLPVVGSELHFKPTT